MLEGRTVNPRIIEKEDLSLVKEWVNDVDFMGEYEPIFQEGKVDLERQYDKLLNNSGFLLRKKTEVKLVMYATFLLFLREESIQS